MNLKKRVSLFVFLLLIILSSCVPDSQPTAIWNPAKGTHTIVSNSHLKLLWEMSIYTEDDSFGNPCAAMDGLLFLVGSEKSTGNVQLMSFDGKEGKRKWSNEIGSIRFTNSKTQLLIGNEQSIISLSPEDGHINWKTLIPQARHIGKLLYYEDKIFVNATGYPFFIISPDNGQVIEKYSSAEGFRRDYPTVPFYPDLNFEPIFIGKDSILSLGKILYTIRREYTAAGNLVWEIKDDSISNPTLILNTLFYISKDDKLKAINVNTGELLYDVSIQPSIQFLDMDRNSQQDGYYLCGDQEKNLLYVILGDSRQLFALLVTD